MNINNETFQLTETGNTKTLWLIAGVLGLVASAAGYFIDPKQFFHSYLTAFVFWVTVGLGGLFFTLVHHLVSAQWSVVVRRFWETAMITLPIMAIFFFPVILGMHDLYHWSHQEAVEHDHLLHHKAPFLNSTFFVARAIGYFLIWFLVGKFLYKNSIEQDKQYQSEVALKMKRYSAPGMILFGLSLTFASFDWLMSLNPHWYSTMYGVYFFSGTLLAILCFTTLVVHYFHSNHLLQKVITVEHYHDLGKLTFGFTVFWAYIGFSQYFLIWYANIPEETVWYAARLEGSWKYISLLLLIAHFIIPFFVLLSREPKRNPAIMKFMAVWILIMHWIDIHWLVLPSFHTDGFHFSWMDITTLIGLGGIFIFFFLTNLFKHSVIPVGDKHLEVSIKFVN